MIGNVLSRLHPSLDIQYHWVESEGDQAHEQSLAQLGGKGLFTRAVERAVLTAKADLAVHSLKDLPAGDRAGLTIAATPPRASVHDCLIAGSAGSIDQLDANAVVGTSSPRRAAQLRRLRPDLTIHAIRGNVETRIEKVTGHEHPYDATFLAYAGLARLKLDEHTQHAIDLEQMLPAACQGALAIQCRSDDHVTLTRCLPLNDATVATAVHAERGVVAGLEADCHAALAVLCQPIAPPADRPRRQADTHWFRLRVRVLASDGQTCLEVDEQARPRDLPRLVSEAVDSLRERGAERLLNQPANLNLPNSPASSGEHAG